MDIAYTIASGRGAVDRLLVDLTTQLVMQGRPICGTVQFNAERADSGPCDMDVRVLPNGPEFRISQDLGPASSGCRLDPSALETAVGLVGARLSTGTDLLVVNKFGKHEAEGRGFRAVIGDALALGIPVLVGVNRLNLDAFLEFAGPDARRLEAQVPVLRQWVDNVTLNAPLAATAI